ncbi:hypothetical protein BD408DRAFT_464879 [Parasitella parasitica]|nr:hypothetical protein BD408DRAFT_464879 [Parasitella parasitica]
MNQDVKPTTPQGVESASSTSEAKDEDVIELIITETGFLKYFIIKGITDKSIKRFIKYRKNNKLQSLYNVLRDIYDDTDTESDASDSEGTTDSEPNVKNKDSAGKRVIKDKKSGKSYDVDDLTVQFKDMALIMIVEEICNGRKEQTGQADAPKRRKVNCYNCQEEDHIAQNCKNPCKICKSPDHVHFQCSQYQGRRSVPAFSQDGANQSLGQSEAMLIKEDALLAEKRRLSEVSGNELVSQARAKRAPRVTRSGLVYGTLQVKTRAIEEGDDAEMSEPSSRRSTTSGSANIQTAEQPATRNIMVPQKQPIHPLLPKGQPGDKEARAMNNVERAIKIKKSLEKYNYNSS